MVRKIPHDTKQNASSSAKQLREDRLKAALKANLARRKAQSRARDVLKEAGKDEHSPQTITRTEQKQTGRPED